MVNQTDPIFEIHPSTKTATELVKKQVGTAKYPWKSLQVGESFYIDTTKFPVKLGTMQSNASRMGKKLNRRFRAVIPNAGWIEVARLPDTVDAKEPESHG